MKKNISFVIVVALLMNCAKGQVKVNSYPKPVPDSVATIFLPGNVSKAGLDFNAAFSLDG